MIAITSSIIPIACIGAISSPNITAAAVTDVITSSTLRIDDLVGPIIFIPLMKDMIETEVLTVAVKAIQSHPSGAHAKPMPLKASARQKRLQRRTR